MATHARIKDPGQAAASEVLMCRSGIWKLVGFLGFLCLYLVLYLLAPMPSQRGAVPRWQMICVSVLLPDDNVPHWFGDPPRVGILDRIPVLSRAMVLLAVGGCLGRVVLRLGRMDGGLNGLEKAVFSLGVGLAGVSLYMLCLGLAGGLQQPLWLVGPAVLVMAACIAMWILGEIGRIKGDAPPHVPAVAHPGSRPDGHAATSAAGGDAAQLTQAGRTGTAGVHVEHSPAAQDLACDWLSPWWLLLALPSLLIIVLGGVLPPGISEYGFDAREYHLQAPKEFYQQGRIGFMPHNVYANMPLGAEMLILAAMAAMGDWWYGALVGKVAVAAFAPLAALGLLAAGRRFVNRSAGIVAAVLYLTTPWVALVSTTGVIDGVLACYAMLALYATILWRQALADRSSYAQSRACLAGLLAGAAMACKYPAVVFVFLPLALWVFVARFVQGGSLNWRPAIVFIAGAALMGGPWYVKNWVLAGNPTYPLMTSMFGGATRTPKKNEQWYNAHRPPGYSLKQFADSVAQVAWASEWIGPAMVPLAAAAWWVRRRRRLVAALTVFAVYILLAWWVLTHRIDRFWLPMLPVLAILAGVGAVWTSGFVWRLTVTSLLLAGTLVSLLLVTRLDSGMYNRYFVPLAELREDSLRMDPWHVQLNRWRKQIQRVLFVGDAEVFDLDLPVVYNTVFDDCVLEEICKGREPEEIRAELLRRGISHIYVNWGWIERYRAPGNYGFTPFVTQALFERLRKAKVLAGPYRGVGHPAELYVVIPRPAALAQPGGAARSAARNR